MSPCLVTCQVSEAQLKKATANSVCPDGCSGHGSCTFSQCMCEEEWKGFNCGTPKEDCCRAPKSNGHNCHIKFVNNEKKCRTLDANLCGRKGGIFVPDGGCGKEYAECEYLETSPEFLPAHDPPISRIIDDATYPSASFKRDTLQPHYELAVEANQHERAMLQDAQMQQAAMQEAQMQHEAQLQRASLNLIASKTGSINATY